MSANPFLIEGPALISFSGGRTSGLMLRRVLDAYDGTLPRDVRVAFFNTGLEAEETLAFVKRVGEEWGVPIQWLEWRDHHLPHRPRRSDDFKHDMRKWAEWEAKWGDLWRRGKRSTGLGFATVDFDTASRRGEPFTALIRKRGYLPNRANRFCTQELKIRTGKRWMVSMGYRHWTNAVGIRADEPNRLAKRKAAPERERYQSAYPLAASGVTEADVMRFWSEQSFDLGLSQDEGNCTHCFAKGLGKLLKLVASRPDPVEWWIEQEAWAAQQTGSLKDSVRVFAQNRPPYVKLRVLAQSGEAPACDIDDDTRPCNCTD